MTGIDINLCLHVRCVVIDSNTSPMAPQEGCSGPSNESGDVTKSNKKASEVALCLLWAVWDELTRKKRKSKVTSMAENVSRNIIERWRGGRLYSRRGKAVVGSRIDSTKEGERKMAREDRTRLKDKDC